MCSCISSASSNSWWQLGHGQWMGASGLLHGSLWLLAGSGGSWSPCQQPPATPRWMVIEMTTKTPNNWSFTPIIVVSCFLSCWSANVMLNFGLYSAKLVCNIIRIIISASFPVGYCRCQYEVSCCVCWRDLRHATFQVTDHWSRDTDRHYLTSEVFKYVCL